MTQTQTQPDKKTAAPPVNGSHDTEAADEEAKATRTPRQVFVVVTKGDNSGEIFVFKNAREAEKFLNSGDVRAPLTGNFEVILGHLQETKQRVSLR